MFKFVFVRVYVSGCVDVGVRVSVSSVGVCECEMVCERVRSCVFVIV